VIGAGNTTRHACKTVPRAGNTIFRATIARRAGSIHDFEDLP
jgi:hypothetical protein